jgi:hypothetical protein
MPNIIEGLIDENQCIGDSLERINNNFDYLDTKFFTGYSCERNGNGSLNSFLSYGNGATNHTGLAMPYDGVLIKAGLAVTLLTGTLTVAPAVNGAANTNYQLSRTGAGFGLTTDILSEYNPLLPLTFNAGDTFGWQQMTSFGAQQGVVNFNVNYIVRFDI